MNDETLQSLREIIDFTKARDFTRLYADDVKKVEDWLNQYD